jgi:hypothetical protein
MVGNSPEVGALFGPTKSIRAGEKLFACDSLCFGSLRFASFARVKADAALALQPCQAGAATAMENSVGARNSHVESVPDHSSACEEFGADALRNAWKKSMDIASGAKSASFPSYPAPR